MSVIPPAGRPAVLALLALAAPALAQPDAPRRSEAATAAYLEGRFVRALTALAVEDAETAARLLDEVLGDAPGDAAVLAARSEAALGLDDPTDAVIFARQATEAAPGRPEPWRALAAAAAAAGRPADAVEALRTARDLAPADLDVLTALADLAAEQRDAALERDALEALVRVGDTVGARLRLSELAESAGDDVGALAQAEAAARLAPTEPSVRRRLDRLRGASTEPAPAGRASTGAPAGDGAALFEAGDYAAAADALLAETAADPRRVEAWALALRALALSDDSRAASTADGALLLFPTVPGVLAGAAEAYAAAGRPGDARDAATRGLEALDLLGDRLPDADALRARLDAILAR